MTTVRQMERLWNAKLHTRLLRELLAARPEASLRVEAGLAAAVASAAMVVIRLDELTQPHVPLYSRLVRTLVETQKEDGSWGDPMTTALCIRALTCGNGSGAAVERGTAFLGHLQAADGLWPAVPIRRLPGDGFVSAFILLQLADQAFCREALRMDDAVMWFEANEAGLDAETRRLWDRARVRCSMRQHSDRTNDQIAGAKSSLWS